MYIIRDCDVTMATCTTGFVNMPFMMDNEQITYVLITMWHLERVHNGDVTTRGPYVRNLTQSEIVQDHCNQHCYSVDWQTTHSTLTSNVKIVHRALNANNVLRMLLTLSWVRGATEASFNLEFRKHNETATYMWSCHLGDEHMAML